MSRGLFATITRVLADAGVTRAVRATSPAPRWRQAAHDRGTAAFLIVAALLLPTSALAQSGQIVEVLPPRRPGLGARRHRSERAGREPPRLPAVWRGMARTPTHDEGEEALYGARARRARLDSTTSGPATTGRRSDGSRRSTRSKRGRRISSTRSGGTGTRTSGTTRCGGQIRMESRYRPCDAL